MSKVTRSIVIEQKTLDKLQEIADLQFTSVSAIIRQAINEKIKNSNNESEK